MLNLNIRYADRFAIIRGIVDKICVAKNKMECRVVHRMTWVVANKKVLSMLIEGAYLEKVGMPASLCVHACT